MGLSVIILARNEAHSIRRCLESVKWAQEIVVFDSGSIDGTPAIAREYTQKVFETDWPGYGPQRARALAQTTQEWVLSLDADEELSPELQTEIQMMIQNSPAQIQGFYLKHQIIFYGQKIKYVMGSDRHLDLFKREHASYGEEQVHESVTIPGQRGHMKHALYHYSYDNLADMVAKMNDYTSLGAKRRLQQNVRSSFAKALGLGLWMFFRNYVLRRGFLDGKAGFILAVYTSETAYYQYMKMVYQD